MTRVLDLDGLKRLAALISSRLNRGSTVCLCGPLGAGKTTFVRFFCQSIGILEQTSSPSYVMQNEYHTAKGLRIEHWDLYRTRQIPEELLEPPPVDTIRFVEWPEHAPELFEQADLVIKLSFSDNPLSEARGVEITGALASAL